MCCVWPCYNGAKCAVFGRVIMRPSVLCLAVFEWGQVCRVWPCYNEAKCAVLGRVRMGPSVSCLAV